MGFYLNDFYFDQESPGDPEEQVLEKILSLAESPAAKPGALLQEAVKKAPEELLVELLKHPNREVRQFAVKALWQIWYSEEGEEAHEELMMGNRALADRRLGDALKLFETVHKRYPNWAEPINKAATVHFLLKRPACSIDLCKIVLELKPHHFGAWNGLVQCALMVNDLELASDALKHYWKLCPHAEDALELDKVIRQRESE